MPYYCTVPRCTSMAGKAKNVSFHQFPRDEELAKLWNRILKRGKPYTKYSKVCSLHFKPEDYTITSVGKNKGQWRTLRKDAVPSQNLPSESPAPYTRQSTGCWVPAQPSLADPLVQQQMAQAIYMQTMLAMQAAGASEPLATNDRLPTPEPTQPSSSTSLSEIELLLRRDSTPKEVTYKCQECTKCFKDPDVFLIHKRTHNTTHTEKENYSTNIQEETIRANPILANLLKTGMRIEPENILTVENQIMTALATNMEAYIRTLTSMIASQPKDSNESDLEDGNDMCRDRNEAKEFECESTLTSVDGQGSKEDKSNESDLEDGNDLCRNEDNNDSEARDFECEEKNDVNMCVDNEPMDDNDKDTSRRETDYSNMSTEEKCSTDNKYDNETYETQNDTVLENHEHTRDENDTHDNYATEYINDAGDKVYEDRNDTHASNHKIDDTRNEAYESKNIALTEGNDMYKNENTVVMDGNENSTLMGGNEIYEHENTTLTDGNENKNIAVVDGNENKNTAVVDGNENKNTAVVDGNEIYNKHQNENSTFMDGNDIHENDETDGNDIKDELLDDENGKLADIPDCDSIIDNLALNC